MGDLPDTNFIEKWTEADRTHEQNKSLKGNGDFLGPNPKRFCTDIFCLILFLLMNCGLAGAVYYIIVTGDVDRLGHGSDFRGDVCGKSGLSNKPFTYFPEPSDTTIVLCISSCPSNVQSKSICYYDTDYVTELPVWGCWDSISCTEFAYYCLPKGKTDRLSVLNVFFYDQNLIKRGAGDVIYVIFT